MAYLSESQSAIARYLIAKRTKREKMKRANRRLNVEEALALFHQLGEGESDGGEVSDLSDVDWSEEECSSDSDHQPEEPRRQKAKPNNAAPVVPAEPSTSTSTPTSTPLVPGRHRLLFLHRSILFRA